MEGELCDDQWSLIALLLPPSKQWGRPRADERRMLNGILWVLRFGATWRDLPRGFGTPFPAPAPQERREQGVEEQIWLTFLRVLDKQS
jgi:transposase